MKTTGEQPEPSITEYADPEAGISRLCKKPDWFQITLTGWSFPKEIQCAKSLPRDSHDVGQAFWSYAPGMERIDQYKLSTNRGRKHLILRAGNRNECERGWDFVPVAYCPSRSPDGLSVHPCAAAAHLVAACWKAEKEDHKEDFKPPEYDSDFCFGYCDAILIEIWPELYEESN